LRVFLARPALLTRDETAAGITAVFAPWPGQKSISNTAYPNYFTASETPAESTGNYCVENRPNSGLSAVTMKLQDFRFLEDPRFRRERLMWIILVPISLLLITGVLVAFYLQHRETVEIATSEDSPPYVPTDIPLTPEQEADRSVGNARQAFMEKDFVKARELLAPVDLEKLKSAEAWELAGQLQLEAGDREAAMTSFNKGLALDPYPGLMFHKALLLRDDGKLDEALTALLAARERAPNDPVISNEYYLIQIEMGRSDQVTAEIEALVAQAGTLGSEKWVVALAGLYLERGNYAEGARFLSLGKKVLDPVAFNQLLENPIILRHQGRPEILPLYLENL
jgi:predicted Zn-dependent protease